VSVGVCLLYLDASVSTSKIAICLALSCTSAVQGILSIVLQYVNVKRLRNALALIKTQAFEPPASIRQHLLRVLIPHILYVIVYSRAAAFND